MTLVALASLLLLSLGQAPLCGPGQRLDPDTPGKCCFPRQTWSPAKNRCVGMPQCPAGMAAKGETCIEAAGRSAMPEAAPYPTPTASPAPVPEPVPAPLPPPPAALPPVYPDPAYTPAPVPQGKTVDGKYVPPGHHVEKQPRGALWGPGVGLFAGGFVFSIFSSIVALLDVGISRNECASWVASTQWIPLAGPIIATAGQGRITYNWRGAQTSCTLRTPLYEFGVFVAVAETVLQAAGITMFVLGFALQETVVVKDETGDSAEAGPRLNIGIGAPGSLAGLSASLTW